LGLKGVGQIDARGLGTIVACFEKARSLGSLLLIGGASDKVNDIFEMMKVDRVLDIYSSEDEAISACCQAA
jgi:anti-anti-sigma regulatory factor